MPSLLRSACRLLPVALVAAMAFVALQAQAQTPPAGELPSGIEITIQPPGGGTPATVVTSEVPGDVTTTYTVARPAGGTQRVSVTKGISVLKLLEQTDTNFDYETITIERPDGGGKLELTKEQIESVKPPVFFTDAQGVTRFIGATVDDVVAAEDYFEVGAAVMLSQERGSRLKVAISPKKKKIDLGGSVRFNATVTGAEPGEVVTYTWGLNGKKQTAGGSSFTQRFPKQDGVYELLVAVRIEGSTVSDTAVAKITVGDPEKADQEQVGSGDSDGGSSTGTGTGTGGDTTYDGSTYTPYTPPPVAPTPPAPTPTPPAPTPEPTQPPDIATSGTPVTGNLLADASDPPPSNILESAAAAARKGKQGDDSDAGEGAGVPEAALSIAGVLALLGLGAGIETRQGRFPRLRLPRRAA